MTVWQTAFYSITSLCALFATLSWCLAAPSRSSVISLSVMALLWPLTNGPMEGHILLSFNSQHGVTTSDLLSAVAAMVALHKGWTVFGKRDKTADKR